MAARSSKPATATVRAPDAKLEALRAAGCLNAHPERVVDPLFRSGDFFDARDLVQVKYEMLRRVRVDGRPVTEISSAFGFSRPSFYLAQSAFDQGGLGALLPQKPGPRRAHKLTAQVLQFVEELRRDAPTVRMTALCEQLRDRFGLEVHPRSVERALGRAKKKH